MSSSQQTMWLASRRHQVLAPQLGPRGWHPLRDKGNSGAVRQSTMKAKIRTDQRERGEWMREKIPVIEKSSEKPNGSSRHRETLKPSMSTTTTANTRWRLPPSHSPPPTTAATYPTGRGDARRVSAVFAVATSAVLRQPQPWPPLSPRWCA